MRSSGGTSLNVLPVLTDLSPTPKSELSLLGKGSPIGQFQSILDRTLSGTTASGGMSSPPPRVASQPYASPLEQSAVNAPDAASRAPQQEQRSPGTERPGARQPNRTGTESAAAGHDVSAHRSGEPPASNHSRSKEQASSKNDSAQKSSAAEKSSRKTDAKKPTGQAANPGKSSKGTEKNPVTKPGRAGDLAKFPGAIIVSGNKGGLQHAALKVAEKAAAMKSASSKTGAETSAKSQKGDIQSQGTAPEKPTKKGIPAKAKVDKKPKQAAAQPLGAGQLLLQALQGNAPGNTSQGQAAAAGSAHLPNHSNISSGQTSQSNAESQTAGVTIIDLRHSQTKNQTNTGSNSNQSHSQDSGNVRLFQLADGGGNTAARMNGQSGMARASGAPAQGQSFQAMTDQIVKQTGILLKDNNSGEIRMVLKPEHLGSLRIKIDMNNNNLTGKILVQNHDALRLVQQNLDSLYRALRDSGFTATELNVSVGGKDGGSRDKERSSPLPQARAIQGVRGFESQTPVVPAEGTASNYSLVNLVI